VSILDNGKREEGLYFPGKRRGCHLSSEHGVLIVMKKMDLTVQVLGGRRKIVSEVRGKISRPALASYLIKGEKDHAN